MAPRSRITQRRHRGRRLAPDDEEVAAAPHLFDDPIASPELALVDADLAAQLRADLATGDAFRPRDVPHAEYPTLVFDAVVRDLPVDEPDIAVDEAALVEDAADPVDDVVPYEEPSVLPVLEALPLPEETSELPEYVVVSDGDDLGDRTLDTSHLAETQIALVDERVELSDDVVPDDEPLVPPVLEALARPEEQSFELPDYPVPSAEDIGDTVDELPDFIVRPVDEPAAALPEYVVGPAERAGVDEAVVDAVFDEDVILPEVVEASTDEAASKSDYPVLPDLEERSDALEETEAALRRIREQLVPTPAEPKRRSRLRRRFTVVGGLCLMAAAGVAAADVQLGMMHGWLGL
jgi:hypothetical protein